jgi:uroporphyrin-III C-methyltransferase
MKIMLFDETPERSLFLRMTLERLGHEIVAEVADSGQLYDAVRKVVRLKGGDPFAFGRGGEKTAALDAAGIPVTHRDAGRGVALITGHSRDGAAVDWEALARSGLTLVIYMGIARYESIVAGLREGGLRADLPAAVIQHATLPQQRVVSTTLSRLVADIKHHGIGSPAILVIGEVANAASTAEQALTQHAAVA